MDFRRAYILMKLSESLTDEERRFLAGQDKERDDEKIMAKLEEIKRGQRFGLDFASNVAGNAAFDSAVFIISKLLKKLR